MHNRDIHVFSCIFRCRFERNDKKLTSPKKIFRLKATGAIIFFKKIKKHRIHDFSNKLIQINCFLLL